MFKQLKKFVLLDINMSKQLKLVAILSLVGALLNIACFALHICMAGHMQHPPYFLYDFISDWLWVFCFGCVTILSFWLKAKRKWWFLFGPIFLLYFRIKLESMGGCSIIIELPLLIVIIVFAIKYLVNPNKYLKTK